MSGRWIVHAALTIASDLAPTRRVSTHRELTIELVTLTAALGVG